MKKGFVFSLFIFFFLSSCNRDESPKTTPNTMNYVGVWKPSHYELKGKTYSLTDCQKKGVINIQTTMAGSYESYETISSNCSNVESFAGTWQTSSSELKLNYSEAGVTHTKILNVNTLSTSQLKVDDNTHNIDGIPGNDEAVIVYNHN